MNTFWRPFWVFTVVMPFVVSFLRDWQGFILFGGPRLLTKRQHAERARRLAEKVALLGPAFIKGAQVLAMRDDILDPVYTRELKKLQDKVPPFATREVLRTIRQSLGRDARAIFDDFEIKPIAAASLGQVHRATYKGKRVAVKVLRPNVEELVASDLRVMGFIIRSVHAFVDTHFTRSFWAIYLEYTRMIRQEMDFRNEERNNARFRKNFANEPRIYFPPCVAGLTTKRTVVFEYVDGDRIDDRAVLERHGLTPTGVLETLIDVYVRMVVVHGFIHADPHPGNLRLDRQGRIAFFDYGMALEFDAETRKEMLRACLAVVARDIDTMVDIFYRLKMVDPDIPRAQVRDAADTLLTIQLRDDFEPRMVQEIADDILATFHKFPLRMPQQLVYLFRASALVEGLGIMFDPKFSAVREATPVIKLAIRHVALGSDKPLWTRALDAARGVYSEINYLRRIIHRLEREEQRVRIHPVDLDRIESHMTALMRRLLVGLGAFLTVCAAFYMGIETGLWLLMAILAAPAMVVFVACAIYPVRRYEPLEGDWWKLFR